MTSSLNNHSDLKHNESIEMEKFNRDKLKEFDMNRDSRPSDPETHNEDPFRPTDNHLDLEGHTFDNSYKLRRNNHEGVDDYDADEFDDRHQNHHKPSRGRTSLDGI